MAPASGAAGFSRDVRLYRKQPQSFSVQVRFEADSGRFCDPWDRGLAGYTEASPGTGWRRELRNAVTRRVTEYSPEGCCISLDSRHKTHPAASIEIERSRNLAGPTALSRLSVGCGQRFQIDERQANFV